MEKQKTAHEVHFRADHSQYLRPMLVNGVAPHIGVGENEEEAYEDALYTLADEYGALLPEKYGNHEHNIAYYFGEDVAKEHDDAEDSELHIFCLIYIF